MQNPPNPGRAIAIAITSIMLRIKVIPIRSQVHLIEMDEPRPLNQLPDQKHDNHDRDLDVERHKVDGLEGRAEAGPALHEDQDDVQADGDDGADGVCPVLEGEEVFEVLAADGGAEAEGSDADADPGDLVGDADDAGSFVRELVCLADG